MEANRRLVVDASVAAKWFLKDEQEEDTEQAEELLLNLLAEEIDLHAPRIFRYEVCSLLARACGTFAGGSRTRRLEKTKAVDCVEQLFDIPIKIAEESLDENRGALELAVNNSKKHYDMTYVWLAQKLDCRWCTADETVLRASPPGFPSDRVLLLSSLRQS